MNTKFFLIAILILVFTCCESEESCAFNLRLTREQSSNIIVTDNINKSSHWGGNGLLKLRGITVDSQNEILFKSKSRGWSPLSDFINVGDTVVKKEGEAIMYVYKRDSIVKRDLSNMCDKDFDWEKDVYTFILRN